MTKEEKKSKHGAKRDAYGAKRRGEREGGRRDRDRRTAEVTVTEEVEGSALTDKRDSDAIERQKYIRNKGIGKGVYQGNNGSIHMTQQTDRTRKEEKD